MPEYHDLTFPDADREETSNSFADWTIWATGFRPFFLGGALVAALLVPVWMAVFFTDLSVGGAVGSIGWHAHEMIFGFTTAIIAGFLLTAVPRWTGVETPSGTGLAALFGLWVAGRIAMAAAGVMPYEVAALVDVAFLPALAIAISIPIGRSRTLRNLGFIPLLFGLAAADAVFHLGVLGIVDGGWSRGLQAGLGLIVVIIAVVGGRVIPFFTSSGLEVDTSDRGRILDIGALGLAVAWLGGVVVAPTSEWTGGLAVGAGVIQLVRMWGWKPSQSIRDPLLWVLHAGYAFVGIGLVLYGFDVFGWTGSRSIAFHALGAGAIGTLCLGMMARVALGHTGRDLEAPRAVAVAFGVVIAAALIRVGVPWAFPELYNTGLGISALLWTGAWVAYLAVYTPILIRPRADGRLG